MQKKRSKKAQKIKPQLLFRKIGADMLEELILLRRDIQSVGFEQYVN